VPTMVGHDFLFSEVVTARKLGAPRANKKQFVDPRKKLDAVGVEQYPTARDG